MFYRLQVLQERVDAAPMAEFDLQMFRWSFSLNCGPWQSLQEAARRRKRGVGRYAGLLWTEANWRIAFAPPAGFHLS